MFINVYIIQHYRLCDPNLHMQATKDRWKHAAEHQNPSSKCKKKSSLSGTWVLTLDVLMQSYEAGSP